MLKEDLPGGVHYGSKLKVIKDTYMAHVNRCAMFYNNYYPLDTNYVAQDEFVKNAKYFIFLTFYNNQWWIYNYICIND